MLQQSIDDAIFLDLFAGSGAMGFEALSRGAKRAVFVDSSKEAVRSIERNVEALDVAAEVSIIKADVLLALGKLEKKGEAFDIIYVDPPYFSAKGFPYGAKVLTAIDAGKLLKEGGMLFIEESKEADLEQTPLKALKFVKKRNFGRSFLFHFEHGAS